MAFGKGNIFILAQNSISTAPKDVMILNQETRVKCTDVAWCCQYNTFHYDRRLKCLGQTRSPDVCRQKLKGNAQTTEDTSLWEIRGRSGGHKLFLTGKNWKRCTD